MAQQTLRNIATIPKSGSQAFIKHSKTSDAFITPMPTNPQDSEGNENYKLVTFTASDVEPNGIVKIPHLLFTDALDVTVIDHDKQIVGVSVTIDIDFVYLNFSTIASNINGVWKALIEKR